MIDLSKYKLIAGVDEVGRGCLSGPVVSAAVILKPGFSDKRIKDSKLIKSQKKREEIEAIIKENSVAWATGVCSPEEIDRHNILQATFISMRRALDSLFAIPDFLMIDGNSFPGYGNIPYECYIKGDALHASISAASILAKTYRDRLMVSLSKEYPDYLWEKNMGYGTRDHMEAIKKIGLSEHHRKTFCTKFI